MTSPDRDKRYARPASTTLNILTSFPLPHILHTPCHNTTDRGWTQLESSGIPGIERDIALSAWMAFCFPVFIVLVVCARLLVAVDLCPSQETSTRETMKPDEDL